MRLPIAVAALFELGGEGFEDFVAVFNFGELAATSSPNAMISATVLPYFRLRRSMRARRSSISARRSGEALMPSA